MEAATNLGIRVSRVRGIIERESVAEYSIALLWLQAVYCLFCRVTLLFGIATESLIRTLSDFKKEKLIDIQTGNVIIVVEATYIWHIQKTREAFRTAIAEIEIILNEINQTGRQNFLEKEPGNFSRIVHDYSDAKKGCITWKGMLEERLV